MACRCQNDPDRTPVGASIGVSVYLRDGFEAETPVERADTAAPGCRSKGRRQRRSGTATHLKSYPFAPMTSAA